MQNESPWSREELDDVVWELCTEFPEAPMLVLAHALEHCRDRRQSRDALLAAMREEIANDPAFKEAQLNFPRAPRPSGFAGRRWDHGARNGAAADPSVSSLPATSTVGRPRT